MTCHAISTMLSITFGVIVLVSNFVFIFIFYFNPV